MRRALDGNPTQTTYHGEPGYGYFGKHAGYDYGVVKWAVRAPEAGTILNVWTGRETADGGNIVEMQGQYTHRFLHLQSASVKPGQKVSEGQELGITGNTGKVDYHLHHDVRKNGTKWTDSYANYVDWEKLIKGTPSAGGNNVFNTDAEVQEAYLLLRGNPGSAAERAGWIGQSKQRFFQVARAEADSVRKQLADVKAALANEKAKPPKEVIKIVEKIVEKPVPTGGLSPEDSAAIKETNSIVKAIRDLLGKVFK